MLRAGRGVSLVLIGALVFSSFLSGCVANGNGQLRSRDAQTQTQNGGEGQGDGQQVADAQTSTGGASGNTPSKSAQVGTATAGWAAFGAIVLGIGGALLCGRDCAAIGLGVGALLGGIGGYAWATNAYAKIEKAKDRSKALDDAINKSLADIQQQQQILAKLQEENIKLDAHTSELAKAYAAKQTSAKKLASTQKTIDNSLADAKKVLESGQNELAYLKDKATPVVQQYGTPEQQKKLESQIGQVETQNAQLEKAITERASYSQRLSTS